MLGKRIKECKLRLKHMRAKRDTGAIHEYKEVKKYLFLILDQQECFWTQRSEQLWLAAGDKNTKYFHAACNTRRRTNRLNRLKNEDEAWVDWHNRIRNLIHSYYTDLFSTHQVNYNEVISCVSQTISQDQNRELGMEVSKGGGK